MKLTVKRLTTIVISFFVLIGVSSVAYAELPAGFLNYTVKRGDTWESVIPDERYREFAMKVNRMNIELTEGKRVNKSTIMVPVGEVALAYVPVPTHISSKATRELVFYKQEQYFGAYEEGRLVKWGPISTGSNGNTPLGTYKALYKQVKKYSSIYNNSRMYYAVQFRGNYFSHEQVLPGVPASKGCVRMSWEDAKWKFHWIKIGDPIRVVKNTGNVGV